MTLTATSTAGRARSLPTPPGEKSQKAERIADPSLLAPGFERQRQRIFAAVARRTGVRPLLWETLRTQTRQTYLYGFGRLYDDGRGIVTRVKDVWTGFHAWGLAFDAIHPVDRWSNAAWFAVFGEEARAAGCRWGGDFPSLHDAPHVQVWSAGVLSPRAVDRARLAAEGLEAVWRSYAVAE